jgi:cytochrome c553
MRVFTGFAAVMALVYASLTGAAAPAPEIPKPDLERGKQIATTVCAACHGPEGMSTAPANPHLAAQGAEYIAAQLAAFKSGARPSPIMAGMAAGLTPEDMTSVGAYYQSQKPVAGLARDKVLATRGQQIWRAGVKATGVPACAGCHGAAGKGIPSPYPRLAGQHADLTFGWLRAYATGTRTHPIMSAVAVKLSDADMKAVAEYAAGLR